MSCSKSFLKGLYDDPVLDRKAVRETITTINDHYRKFVEINDGDICPFCGLEGLDGQYEETRELTITICLKVYIHLIL